MEFCVLSELSAYSGYNHWSPHLKMIETTGNIYIQLAENFWFVKNVIANKIFTTHFISSVMRGQGTSYIYFFLSLFLCNVISQLERKGLTAGTYNYLETSTILKFTLPCADVIRQSKKCVQTMEEENNFIKVWFGWMGHKKLHLSVFRKTFWINKMREIILLFFF